MVKHVVNALMGVAIVIVVKGQVLVYVVLLYAMYPLSVYPVVEADRNVVLSAHVVRADAVRSKFFQEHVSAVLMIVVQAFAE